MKHCRNYGSFRNETVCLGCTHVEDFKRGNNAMENCDRVQITPSVSQIPGENMNGILRDVGVQSGPSCAKMMTLMHRKEPEPHDDEEGACCRPWEEEEERLVGGGGGGGEDDGGGEDGGGGGGRRMLHAAGAAARGAARRAARHAAKRCRGLFPVLDWLPRYRANYIAGDALGGLTVAMTLVPQAIAYAALAGLPPQHGLYSALSGGLVYIIFGTCSEINIQLTALLALLTATYTEGTSTDMAVLLCFLSGIVQLACGALKLGFLVDFVSAPVVQGFTAAAALTIASSQLKALLGLSFDAQGFVGTWRQLVRHLPESRGHDMALAAASIVILLSLRALQLLSPSKEGEDDLDDVTRRRRAVARHACWLLSTGRNAFVVVAATVISGVLDSHDQHPFLLSGFVEGGLPPFRPPPFTTTYGNHTVGTMEMLQHLGPGIAIVPVISILGNVAIAKAFARGRIVDATQEMVALGACNVFASFLSSAPVGGSFTMSAVAKASGVHTPLASLYTASLIAMALSLLTQYFAFIPRAALGAVVVCAVLFMPDFRSLVPMWRSSKSDLIPFLATFAASLALGMAQGLLVGMAADVALLLIFTARPHISSRTVQCEGGMTYVQVTPWSGLSFPCADHVRGALTRALADADEDASPCARPAAVVLDLCHTARADFSAALGIAALAAELREAKRPPLVLLHARPSVAEAIAAAAAPVPPPHAVRTAAEIPDMLRGICTDVEVSKL